jgi:hypothetical protein
MLKSGRALLPALVFPLLLTTDAAQPKPRNFRQRRSITRAAGIMTRRREYESSAKTLPVGGKTFEQNLSRWYTPARACADRVSTRSAAVHQSF